MSNYFKNFPVVDYKFGNELGFNRFQHLGTAVDILDQVKQYSVYYKTYNIQNGERPEQLSAKLYGNVNHYWTFYLLNDHLRQSGWPIREADIYPKAQQYYPNTVIKVSAVTQDKEPRLIETSSGDPIIEYIPTNEQIPMAQSNYFRPGNYLYFKYSKVAGELLKIDQEMGMIWTTAKDIRGIDDIVEVIDKEDALKVMADREYVPNVRLAEMEIIEKDGVYDEWDAPHHYEDASGNWIYPEYSGEFPYPINHRAVNTLNSVSYYQRLVELNNQQKAISVIKPDSIDRIVREFNNLLSN